MGNTFHLVIALTVIINVQNVMEQIAINVQVVIQVISYQQLLVLHHVRKELGKIVEMYLILYVQVVGLDVKHVQQEPIIIVHLV